MITRTKAAVIALIAVITFILIADKLVWDYKVWECKCSHIECDYCVNEWDAYHADAYAEYEDEFTALFNSYETKVAKNGAMMIRKGNSGSFKFAKKG